MGTETKTAIPVARLNHAVLYVRDLDRSVDFYSKAFGFNEVAREGGMMAFLRASGTTNHHDLGLMAVGPNAEQPSPRSVGLYHLAWEVPTIEDLAAAAAKLAELDALTGMSDHGATGSLYGATDGIELRSCGWCATSGASTRTMASSTRWTCGRNSDSRAAVGQEVMSEKNWKGGRNRRRAEYSNDKIAVSWEPRYCMHAFCLMETTVFGAMRRPGSISDAGADGSPISSPPAHGRPPLPAARRRRREPPGPVNVYERPNGPPSARQDRIDQTAQILREDTSSAVS
jgi:catechol 2,3-dioxygenase-like lactoylglutathione lyase family enzyme